MPIPPTPRRRRRPPLRPRPAISFPRLLAAASLYAAVELLLTLTLGRFLECGRAEALLFLAGRPWLLIVAAGWASSLPWPRRLFFYASALLLAGLCESLFVLGLGAAHAGESLLPGPWPEMLRGLAAGALLLVPVDLLLRLARRGRRRRAAIAAVTLAAVALGALLLVPAVRKPYDALIAGPGDGPPAAQRPRLLLMTSLPIVWGEYGAFDRRSRPSQTLRALREEFEIVPIDVLDRPSLADGRLLLLAQPRWLSPVELTALDAWIRGGGRALILADPDLVWPSDLPLGDVRRPLTASLLGPLLAHWRLELLPPPRSGAVPWLADDGRRRIVMDSPGRFAGGGAECRVRPPAFHARCAIGAGRAILLADADLVRDDLWVAPRAGGDARALRLADNPLHIADLLDEVAGLRRERVRLPVAWVDPRAPVGRALLLALLPLILLWGGAGLPIGWRNFGHTLFHRLTKGEQDRNRS